MISRLTTSLIKSAVSAPRLLIACDFDGTLCRIARHPDLVFLPEHAREILDRLNESPGATVAVVSGRRLSDLQQRVGLPLIYAGNHGLEIRGQGLAFEHPAATASAHDLERACDVLDACVGRWDGAWVERKRLTATVHYRNVAAGDQHRVAMSVRRCMAPFGTAFSLRAGKRSLEVRPRLDWHKGSAIEFIREQLHLNDALCVCFGDDVTDENMFRTLAGQLTVRVGWHASSCARFFVEDENEVHHALAAIAELRSGRTMAAVHTVVA